MAEAGEGLSVAVLLRLDVKLAEADSEIEVIASAE
jgi:hypothetical protein